jgi:hypothetical protein
MSVPQEQRQRCGSKATPPHTETSNQYGDAAKHLLNGQHILCTDVFKAEFDCCFGYGYRSADGEHGGLAQLEVANIKADALLASNCRARGVLVVDDAWGSCTSAPDSFSSCQSLERIWVGYKLYLLNMVPPV